MAIKEKIRSRGPRGYLLLAGMAVMVALLLIAACGDDAGEDRPGIEVIDTPTGSVSVSGTGTGTGTGTMTATGTGTGTMTATGTGTGTMTATGTGTGTMTATGTGTGTMTATGTGTGTGTATVSGDGMMMELESAHYVPVSNVVAHASISLDIRDIKALLNNAKTGDSVNWEEITAIYEEGKYSRSGDGFRTLHSLATSDSVLAEFPGGTDLDGNVRTGLTGQWLGEAVDDQARRNLVDKSIQAIIYGKVNQELTSARNQLLDGNTDDASGAPHKVDEGWAFYVGVPGDDKNFPYSISATARSREGNFGLDGLVDIPLQQALARALESSRAGDLAEFDAAAAEARGYLNTIFYLATLRYAAVAMNDDNETARKIHLAEGWAFYQSIRPAIGSAVPQAGTGIDSFFTRDASNEIPESEVLALYGGLNHPAITSLLGIPESVRVTSPDQLQ